MNKKCQGCGAELQCNKKDTKGYIPKDKIDSANYCERCFKIIHYNEKIITNLDNINEYIINEINKKAKYVYFLVDFLNINEETINTFKSIKTKKTLIISKLDIIPKSIKESVISKWLKEVYNISEEIIYQSTKKNINTRAITRNLENQSIKECYVVGYTNAGKSTLINKLSTLNELESKEITTSSIPNTTIDFIKIDLNENLSIIDSPGFTLNKAIYIDDAFDLIKRITPKSFLKPITYQVKDISSIIIENKIRIKSSINNSLTFYMSNDICIERVFEKNQSLLDKEEITLKIPANSDLVIKSLGFINIKKECTLKINSEYKELFEIRDSMFRNNN